MSAYTHHTIGSRNPLKRWLHRQRFAASLRLLDLQDSQRFLDYGCGDGEVSFQVHRHFPQVAIVAYDPAEELFLQATQKLATLEGVTVTNDLQAITGTFDRIACLETVEHLPAEELHAVCVTIKNLLQPSGYCLFTFPIEHGVASLLKNTYRLLTKRDKYASLRRTLQSTIGIFPARETPERLSNCNYIYSHIGFDCRAMLATLGEHFTIVHTSILPFGTAYAGLGNGMAVIVRK